MPRITAAQGADKWARRLGGATTDMQNGANAVQTAPGVDAAAQAQKWLANVTASQQKWQTKTAAVPLQVWKDAYINKGIPRVAQGAQAAVPKVTTAFTTLYAFESTLEAQVRSMPDLTLQDAINRMIAWVNGMSTYVG